MEQTLQQQAVVWIARRALQHKMRDGESGESSPASIKVELISLDALEEPVRTEVLLQLAATDWIAQRDDVTAWRTERAGPRGWKVVLKPNDLIPDSIKEPLRSAIHLQLEAAAWIAHRDSIAASRHELQAEHGILTSEKPEYLLPEYLDEPLRSEALRQLGWPECDW